MNIQKLKPVSAWKSRNPSNTEFAFRRRLWRPTIHKDTFLKINAWIAVPLHTLNDYNKRIQ